MKEVEEILGNYKERLLKSTSSYEHIVEFKCGLSNINSKVKDVHSYYLMDCDDRFWIETELCEMMKVAKNNSRKYIDIMPSEQVLMSLVFVDEISKIKQKEYKIMLKIIFTNHRLGTPRKRLHYDKKIYDIHLKKETFKNKNQYIK